jgi:hypothetical protein
MLAIIGVNILGFCYNSSSFFLLLLFIVICVYVCNKNQTPWPESASELYRPRGRRLSAKLMLYLGVEGRRVVSAADPL